MDKNSFLTGLRVGMQLRLMEMPSEPPTFMRWTADPEWLCYYSGIIATADHSSRTPYTKANDGMAIVVYSYDHNDGAYGGNWCSMTVISTERSCAEMLVSNGALYTLYTTKQYLGLTWHIYTSAQNASWGGATELNTAYPMIDWQGAAAFIINGSTIPDATFLTIMQAAHVRLA